MTLQLIVLNRNRSFAVSDSTVTIDECKTYDGAQKIFKISDKLSTILLLSGNSRFYGVKMEKLIDEFVSKTDFNHICSVDEIKDALNKSIAKSTRSLTVDEYVEETFGEFEISLEKSMSNYDAQDQKIEFLKLNSFYGDIDFLKGNKLLNSNIIKLTNSLFDIKRKNEFDEVKSYLVGNYLHFLIKDSPNIVLFGYDEINENPTYFNYVLLINMDGKIETIERYSLHNCDSTMVMGIAQDDDVELILTGFNDDSFRGIHDIVFELFDEFGNFNSENHSALNSINEKLGIGINELKLNNLKVVIDYINFLPDSEIFELLDALMVMTSVKMKFSSKVHSVGGKQIKVLLKKYEDIRFIE